MKIAFIVYDDMTALDFIGVYDPIARLKSMGFCEDLLINICACTGSLILGNVINRIKVDIQ